jgi:hypothetical protein
MAHAWPASTSHQPPSRRQQLAIDCEIDAEFVCSDVYNACDALAGRSFDIVYTEIGALGWLPDLDEWARVVDGLLRTGGALYLVEIHPIVLGVLSDGRTLQQDIFEAPYVRWDEKGGTYAAPDATFVNTTTFERVHSLSDVISAVLGAGLSIELFHEQSYTNAPWPWTVKGEDGFHRLPHGWRHTHSPIRCSLASHPDQRIQWLRPREPNDISHWPRALTQRPQTNREKLPQSAGRASFRVDDCPVICGFREQLLGASFVQRGE